MKAQIVVHGIASILILLIIMIITLMVIVFRILSNRTKHSKRPTQNQFRPSKPKSDRQLKNERKEDKKKMHKVLESRPRPMKIPKNKRIFLR